MTDKLKAKSVPWDSIQKYIAGMQNNQAVIGRIITLKDDGVLELPLVEAKCAGPMLQMHELIHQILKDNNIIDEGEQERTKMEIMVSTVMKLQHTFLSQNATNQQEIRAIIKSIIP